MKRLRRRWITRWRRVNMVLLSVFLRVVPSENHRVFAVALLAGAKPPEKLSPRVRGRNYHISFFIKIKPHLVLSFSTSTCTAARPSEKSRAIKNVGAITKVPFLSIKPHLVESEWQCTVNRKDALGDLGPLQVSRQFFGRVAGEFLSLRWLMEEVGSRFQQGPGRASQSDDPKTCRTSR